MQRFLSTVETCLARLESGMARPLRRVCALADGLVSAACVGGLALLTLAQPAFRDTGPGWLKQLDLAVTFLDREGREIGRRGIRHDNRGRLEDLPAHLIAAVIATEDRRFFHHAGIDPVGLLRALAVNAEAEGVVQGGSTLTQQLAKNLFLTGERTIERKIREAFLAIWLESHLTKAEILKLYLDRVYLGAGTFGMEAAAQFYFGKSGRDVSVAEAAVLAGLLKAPSRYAPHLHPAAARMRAGEVLDRMRETGAIDHATWHSAKENPAVALARRERPAAPDFYLDWAFREVKRLAAADRLGPDPVLTVETPFDPALQASTERAVERALARNGDRFGVRQAAAVIMDPQGGVRAMVGGPDYAESQFNRATDALRQPGSSFKPFVYAAAIAHTHLRPASSIQDSEICIGTWCPANYGRTFAGTISLTSALANSINTVAVRLSIEIGRAAGELGVARQARAGRARVIELARSMGLTTRLHDTPSLTLGASEVRLIDMTAAYAAFANGGERAEPFSVALVRNGAGTAVFRHPPPDSPGLRVLGPEVAADMNTMLARVVEAGTARAAALPGHAVAGKTGTTSAYRDAWFVGFTAHLVGGVWFGNDDHAPTRKLAGGGLPAAVWHDAMAEAHRGLAPRPLPGRDGPRIASRSSRGGFSEVAAGSGPRGFEAVRGPRASFSWQ